MFGHERRRSRRVLNTATESLASYRCGACGYAIAAPQNGWVRIHTRLTPEYEVSTAILILRFEFSLDERGDAEGTAAITVEYRSCGWLS